MWARWQTGKDKLVESIVSEWTVDCVYTLHRRVLYWHFIWDAHKQATVSCLRTLHTHIEQPTGVKKCLAGKQHFLSTFLRYCEPASLYKQGLFHPQPLCFTSHTSVLPGVMAFVSTQFGSSSPCDRKCWIRFRETLACETKYWHWKSC